MRSGCLFRRKKCPRGGIQSDRGAYKNSPAAAL